jgi:hypothetical protein
MFTATFAPNLKLSGMRHKVFYVLCFCVLVSFASSAQFSKGDRMVGANIGSIFFNSGKTVYTYPPPTTGITYNTRGFGVNVNPLYGWFISNNIVVGPSVNFSYSRKKAFYTDDSNGNTYNSDLSKQFSVGVGGFLRNYFASAGSFLPYGQVGFNLGTATNSDEGFYFTAGTNDKSSYEGKSSGDLFINTGLSLGVTKMLSKYTGLDFSVGYNLSYEKSNFKRTTQFDAGNNGTIDQTSVSQPTQKYTNHGFVLGVGFQVFLEGKKKK